MDDYRNAMIRSIDNRLRWTLKTNGGPFGVPAALRADVTRLLLDVSGATLDVERSHPVVRLVDGGTVRDTHPDHVTTDAAHWPAIGAALDHWLEHGRPPPALVGTLPVAAGSARIASAMGSDLDRLCALTYVTTTATTGRDGATLAVRHGPDQRLHGEYTRGRLRWRDGVVTVPHGPLPQSIRLALRGRRLGELVDDPVIGDVEIATVIDADRRERVLRIRTVDADRFIR